jgi:hypothetical protein
MERIAEAWHAVEVHPWLMASRYRCRSSWQIGSPVDRCRRQSGFTLVELMIASFLGLFLVGGLIHLFVSSGQGYRANDALARVQESGRFAMDILARDIRQVGYGARCTFETLPLGEDDVGGDDACFNLRDPLLRWADKDDVGPWNPDAEAIPALTSALDPDPPIPRDLIRVKHVIDGTSAVGAVERRVKSSIYYIGTSPTGASALWMETKGADPEPLVEHVNGMEVVMGDSSVRLTLSVVGPSAADSLQKTFTTTIALRNWLP